MYDLPMTLSPWQPVYVVSFFSVVAVTVLLFLQRRRWPAIFAAWICYAALIAPVSGIAQSGSQIVADRYTYLSCLSWALITAGAALDIRRRLPEKPSAGIAMSALAIAILSTLAFLTHKQISVWRDSESLYEYALANTPRPSKIAFNNLGGVLADGGELDRAIPYFRRALEIDPNFDDARLNLGNALVAQGKLDEAIAEYRKVLRRVPDSLAVHHDLGLALAKKGNIEEAMEHYRKALEIDSTFVEGHSNLGLLLAAKGRYPEAISEYREALKLKPDFAVAHVNWGDVLLAMGDRQAAIQHFRKALELDPNLGSARSSLAKALAAEPRGGASVGH
jgi:protein O-mannosyl-transferase